MFKNNEQNRKELLKRGFAREPAIDKIGANLKDTIHAWNESCQEDESLCVFSYMDVLEFNSALRDNWFKEIEEREFRHASQK